MNKFTIYYKYFLFKHFLIIKYKNINDIFS